MLYWFFQIFGAMLFGVAIDSSRFRRRVRGWAGLGVVTALSMAVWGGCYSFQVSVISILPPSLARNSISDDSRNVAATLERISERFRESTSEHPATHLISSSTSSAGSQMRFGKITLIG